MSSSDRQLKRLYNKLNRLYFKGELPYDVEIFYAPVAAFAMCERLEDGTFVLQVSTAISGYTDFVTLSVLHEMVHVYLHPDSSHGKRFDDEIKRLMGFKAIRKLI